MAGQVTSGAADYYTDDDSISTHRNEILAIRTTITSSATENGTLVSTAREIASAWDSYPERTSDNPFDVSSTTITNNVPWKDNNGRILETGRGGKISRFDGYWWWVGSQPAKVWVSTECTTTSHSLLPFSSLTDADLACTIYPTHRTMAVIYTCINQKVLEATLGSL
jgi:hypothetical protein